MKCIHSRKSRWPSTLSLLISGWISMGAVTLSADITNLPEVQISSLGNQVAVWQDDSGGVRTIQAALLGIGDTNWTTPVTISTGSGADSTQPVLQMDPFTGNSVAVWLSTDTTNKVRSLWAATLQAGVPFNSASTWSVPTMISTVADHNVRDNFSVNMSVTNVNVLTTDYVTVVYSAYVLSSDRFEVFSSTYTPVGLPTPSFNGGTWSSPKQITQDPGFTAFAGKKERNIPKKQPSLFPQKDDPSGRVRLGRGKSSNS